MNKTLVKNFAINARRKLIKDITNKLNLLGINEETGIQPPLPQSNSDIQFFDINAFEHYQITGKEKKQREKLVEELEARKKQSSFKAAFQDLVEEVTYTWFNRIIAIRFMEVNDYLPSRVRVLSSEKPNKIEPDLVTNPFSVDLGYTEEEKQVIVKLKNENKLDELFQLLFIKQCNKLHEILPNLFEKTNDYTEILLSISITDPDGVIYRLVHDIPEDYFNVEKSGQIEIIGWLYQYYISEKRDQIIDFATKAVVKKENIPAATQLFTTDWVVQYMVDNSLGKYWIERNPESPVKKDLKYLISDEIDVVDEKIFPEEIRVLDNCMGSGHILVYAFEVFMKIYTSLGYTPGDAAIKILENNLYGLDIDKRAYQLAYFALMMKARQYNRNIFTKKPHCNINFFEDSTYIDRNYLEYFGVSIKNFAKKNKAKEQLEYLINLFENARELGSIINIKKEIEFDLLYEYIKHIKCDYLSGNKQITIHNQSFEETLKRIKRLLDVANILSKKYHAVITNPPYLNRMDENLKNYVKKHYKDYSRDLFSVFIYKNINLCFKNGYSAYMSPNVWMFIKSYQKLRNYLINEKHIDSLIHIAKGAFYKEATVDVMTFVIKNNKSTTEGYYLGLGKFKKDMNSQRLKVLEAINNKKSDFYFKKNQNIFSKIPGMPIAYWASKSIIKSFDNILLGEFATPKCGLKTGITEKYTKRWFEVSFTDIGFNIKNRAAALESKYKWFPTADGGKFRKWYGNLENVVYWYNDGFEIRNLFNEKGKLRSRPQNMNYYYKKGITWSALTSKKLSLRILNEGQIISGAGYGLFHQTNNLKTIMALLNSKVTGKLSQVLSSTLNYEVGVLEKIPVILFDDNRVKDLVNSNIEISKKDWNSFETSWDFKKHPILKYKNSGYISDAFAVWKKEAENDFYQLKANEEELNRIFIEIYGLQEELTPEVEEKDITITKIVYKKSEEDKKNSYVLDKTEAIKTFISYAVGCIFGRYSLDGDGLAYAGGEWDDSKYLTFIPEKDNVILITDENYFDNDIVGRFVGFVKVVFGEEHLEENLDFIAAALTNNGFNSRQVIRNYFLKDFYKDHCKMYKMRPIYWLFDSGKENGFKALIYMHRYNENTIGKLRVDYLHKLQRIYEHEIAQVDERINFSEDNRTKAREEKRKEKLQKQLKEIKEYDEKISHLALSQISIDLDDGVKVNYEKVQTDKNGIFMSVLARI